MADMAINCGTDDQRLYCLGGATEQLAELAILYGTTKNVSKISCSIGETGASSNSTRVGRWMSEAEYNQMIETGKVQMSPNGNTIYVANPANPNVFKAASNGSIYVEFDIPTGSVYPAGNENLGQIPGSGSFMDRINQSKGLTPINGMPDAINIEIPGR